jgi:hypothetical protein
MRTDVSGTDRIGNGIVAGFIATLAVAGLHEAVSLLTETVGLRTQALGLLFHFFVGTLLWGGAFGFTHDYLRGPSWVRGVTFATCAALLVMLVAMPLNGAGLLGLHHGVAVPFIIALIHVIYGALLGGIYGKLIDTDDAQEQAHPHDIHAHH